MYKLKKLPNGLNSSESKVNQLDVFTLKPLPVDLKIFWVIYQKEKLLKILCIVNQLKKNIVKDANELVKNRL